MCFYFQILNCPVCFEIIYDLNALICGHIICLSCSERLERRLNIKCPVCRTRSFIIRVKNNYCLNCYRSLKKCNILECGHPYCSNCLNKYKYKCCQDSRNFKLYL